MFEPMECGRDIKNDGYASLMQRPAHGSADTWGGCDPARFRDDLMNSGGRYRSQIKAAWMSNAGNSGSKAADAKAYFKLYSVQGVMTDVECTYIVKMQWFDGAYKNKQNLAHITLVCRYDKTSVLTDPVNYSASAPVPR
ncbi:hypothetical protein COCMIDRAFT_21800 [Bipolaris oryzae ATCC 44560]|uniref:Uncharacterized protein n=1 Tax=Bipolaris oryzae ATCC 44560 TaxID=930090 RepID=W7A421_COCMI|nr:uncharacterized protein COCMIDRAFT_21800 [Bipolaris oryzae ATCC 44560]EUC50786.1 hypothetical protein COCMIDRAFT_21800 [Bipolaris oryzae ATCC 44560]